MLGTILVVIVIIVVVALVAGVIGGFTLADILPKFKLPTLDVPEVEVPDVGFDPLGVRGEIATQAELIATGQDYADTLAKDLAQIQTGTETVHEQLHVMPERLDKILQKIEEPISEEELDELFVGMEKEKEELEALTSAQLAHREMLIRTGQWAEAQRLYGV